MLAPNAKLRARVVPGQAHPEQSAQAQAASEEEAVRLLPGRLGWAKLLKRVFNFDMSHCPNCGGELKIIAAMVQRASIRAILEHMGLEARAPLRWPARQARFEGF